MEVVIYCVSKKRLFLLGVFLFLTMLITGIYSLNDEINKAESGLSTSAVDIEIKEYNQNNQPFDQDGSHVMPGDEIILIPRINNLGIECYLRAKIEYYIENENFPITDYIEGNYTSWTKRGEYYYYDSIFPKEGSIDLFNKVTIPNVSSDYNGKTIVVHIIVEAIQAKHFDGNWDDVEIKESVDRAYDINYDGESSVIFEDNASYHITIENEFFDKLGNMIPGDSAVETVNLLNRSDSKKEYFLSIDYNDLTNEELALLQKMKLKITKQDNEVILDSNLASKDKHSLGIYSYGKGEIFKIEVSLPNDIDNNYSKLFAKVIWRFSFDDLEKHEEVNPHTGDMIFDLSINLFIASSMGFIIVLFLWKNESEKEDK